jgi:HlyD family secretion protein
MNSLAPFHQRDRLPAESPRYLELAPEPVEEPGPSFRKAALAGLIAIAIGCGGFLTWGFLAPLDSAAVASGYIIVDTKRKSVTHLEGGILKRLLVAEGDQVKAGQPLLELDDTRARSNLEQLRGLQIAMLAKRARLQAEQTGAAKIDFPPELTTNGPDNSYSRTVMATEQSLFEKRNKLYAGSLDAQRKAIEQAQAEADAAASMATAAERQRVLVSDQLEKIQGLAAKGYATWRSASDLDTQLSQIIGNAGQYSATGARARQAKAAAEIALLQLETDRQRSIAEEMQDTQLKLNDTEQKIIGAQDILSRLVLRAPVSGTVLEIQYVTPGSSVAAGQKVLDIVPNGQELIVDAKLAPRDIESVHVGATTQVRLTGFDQRVLAPLRGTVTYVGADQSTDERTGVPYYTVRASVAPGSLANHPSVKLLPGMPADLVIKNRSRRAIDYFIEPITNTFQRAFHEN